MEKEGRQQLGVAGSFLRQFGGKGLSAGRQVCGDPAPRGVESRTHSQGGCRRSLRHRGLGPCPPEGRRVPGVCREGGVGGVSVFSVPSGFSSVQPSLFTGLNATKPGPGKAFLPRTPAHGFLFSGEIFSSATHWLRVKGPFSSHCFCSRLCSRWEETGLPSLHGRLGPENEGLSPG